MKTLIQKISSVPLPDLFTGSTQRGKIQVYKTSPKTIYFTICDGIKNPTYTFVHQKENIWKAIPKLKRRQKANVPESEQKWQRSKYPMPTKKNIITGKYISPEKLLDVRWLEKRIEVLKRDGERCQDVDEDGKQCKKSSKNGDRLEVHHEITPHLTLG